MSENLPTPIPAPASQQPMLPPSPELLPHQDIAKNFIKTHPFCGIFFDMGLGKAIDDEVYIPTYYGPKQVKDLLPGDLLIDMHGNPCHIQAVFHHTNIAAYEVKLSDGRKFICSEDHLIPLTESEFNSEIHPTPLKDILGKELKGTNGKYQFAIPMNGAAWHQMRDHTLPPEDIGAILGTARILPDNRLVFCLDEYPTVKQISLRNQLRMLAVRYGTKLDTNVEGATIYYSLQSDEATEKLKENLMKSGCTENLDSIPNDYLFDCLVNRTALLGAILGPDIGLVKNINNPQVQRNIKVTYRTKHEQLAKDIQQLIYSLGFTCQIIKRHALGVYEIRAKLYHSTTDRLYIKSIKRVKSRNMTCFTVTSPTHTYLINDYIPTHNTLLTLTAIYELNPRGHVLVIAPKNIARTTWLNEIKKWKLPIRTKSFVCDKDFKPLTKKKRLELYAQVQTDKPTMYFINRELLPDLVNHMPRINGRETWYFPHLIIDESQSFKNYKSVRFKALKRVRPCLRSTIILTGTPAPKDLMDLWAQIYILDMGYRLGKTITAYRNTFFREVLYVNGHCVKWEPLPGAEEEIYRRISDIVISEKNAIQLPPITYNYFTVYMEPDEWELYKQFAKEAVMDVDCDLQITAANRGVLHNKLAQLASGTIYIDDQHNYRVIHNHKIEACKQIIAGSSGSVMIAYFYNSDREIILNEIPDARLFDGSNQMLEDWNAGKIPVMLIHPASSGHGLNFQYGGHVLIWYSIIDNLEYYLQTNARLHRNGQTQPVIIHHLVCDKTVDVSGIPSLTAKEEREQRLLDAVRIAVKELDASDASDEPEEPS